MTNRRGVALAAVLAALVLMGMLVSVGAQRALVRARESALSLARAEMSVAASGAVARVLATPVDPSRLAVIATGAILDSGTVTVGVASARWVLVGSAPPYATVEIASRAPVFRGTARALQRGFVALRADTMGALWWVPATAGGWVRVPIL